MRYIYLLLTLLSFSVRLAAQATTPPANITASAIWKLPAQFMTAAHAACGQSSAHVECMIGQMAKNGAPEDAVRFTHELYKQSHGEFGIMTGFHDEGPIAFAWLTYPLRANTNYGFLLVNGRPRIVNVEDPKLLDLKTMKQSYQFHDTKAQFPRVDVWPGDRDGKIWPDSQPGPNGGVQFSVSYPLRNGCHACAHAGDVIFTWNFDAAGKFLGTSFQGMLDPPLQ